MIHGENCGGVHEVAQYHVEDRVSICPNEANKSRTHGRDAGEVHQKVGGIGKGNWETRVVKDVYGYRHSPMVGIFTTLELLYVSSPRAMPSDVPTPLSILLRRRGHGVPCSEVRAGNTVVIEELDGTVSTSEDVQGG